MRSSRPGRRALPPAALLSRLAVALCTVAVAAGCADFPDTGDREFRDKPELNSGAGPQPGVPSPAPPGEPQQPQQQPGQGPPPPPDGCTDFDPVVVATCLDPVSAIAVLPDGQAAMVAERATGRVLRVEKDVAPVVIATLPVDPAGGGLHGLTLSPSYAEDELLYAYLTTPTDNQVVRVVPGAAPKPVLTGIPRAPSGNSGAITVDAGGALVVATGNGGDAASAADPQSLAGKVLRIDPFGAPAPGNPDPTSPVVASGLRTPGGLCSDPVLGTTYVTDADGARDLLLRVRPGQPLGAAAWSWADRPGATGCVAAPGLLAVTLTGAAGLFVLRTTPDGGFTGQPQTLLQGTYGRLTAAALGPDALLWLGTANKAGGTPVSSDDRVIRIPPPSGGGSGID